MNPTLKVDHQSFIAWAVRRGLPYLDAEAANKRIVELTVEVMVLRAEINAMIMVQEGKV